MENSGKTLSFGKIKVRNVKPALRSGYVQAEIEQKVITSYSSQPNSGNNLLETGSMMDAFEVPTQEVREYTSTRVTWLEFPAMLKSGNPVTVQFVQKLIDARPNARILSYLSHRPILTQGQKQAIASKDLNVTLDKIAMRQLVRQRKEDGSLEIALEDGLPVFKVNVFVEDHKGRKVEDTRAETANNAYINEVIQTEIESYKALTQGATEEEIEATFGSLNSVD